MTAEQKQIVGIYEGAIRFHGAEREIPLRGVLDSDGFLGAGEGNSVIVDIDMIRRGEALAGFTQVTTPHVSAPVAVAARIDRDTIIISGPEFEGRLRRSA